MKVPTLSQGEIIDRDGRPTKGFQNLIIQLLQNMQSDLSNEGFQIPAVSSDPNSVTPPTVGGQLLQIQNAFGLQGGPQAGYLIFDPYEVNGGSGPTPRLGQLKVLLANGVFAKVVNL